MPFIPGKYDVVPYGKGEWIVVRGEHPPHPQGGAPVLQFYFEDEGNARNVVAALEAAFEAGQAHMQTRVAELDPDER